MVYAKDHFLVTLETKYTISMLQVTLDISDQNVALIPSDIE
jgi:hypothetical protein